MACPERGIVTALGSWQLALSWVKRWRRRLAVSGEDISLSLSAEAVSSRSHGSRAHDPRLVAAATRRESKIHASTPRPDLQQQQRASAPWPLLRCGDR